MRHIFSKLLIRSIIVFVGVFFIVSGLLLLIPPQYESQLRISSARLSGWQMDDLKIFHEKKIRKALKEKNIDEDSIFNIQSPRYSDIIIVSGISNDPAVAKQIAEIVGEEIIMHQKKLISSAITNIEQKLSFASEQKERHSKLAAVYLDFSKLQKNHSIAPFLAVQLFSTHTSLAQQAEKELIDLHFEMDRISPKIVFEAEYPEIEKLNRFSLIIFGLLAGCLAALLYYIYYKTKDQKLSC